MNILKLVLTLLCSGSLASAAATAAVAADAKQQAAQARPAPATRIVSSTYAFVTIPVLAKQIQDTFGKNIKEYQQTIIAPIIHREVQFAATHTPLYHAQNNNLTIITDFLRELYGAVQGKEYAADFELLRHWQKGSSAVDFTSYLDGFPQTFKSGPGNVNDNVRAISEVLLPVNFTLFGNLGHGGESTYHYFLNNVSQARGIAAEVLRGIFVHHGLD